MFNQGFSVQLPLENFDNLCVDVHHHYFPPDLGKGKPNAKLGWKTPEENLPWSAETSLRAMDQMKVDISILSLPALSNGSVGEENRTFARKMNQFASQICCKYPHRFDFFATLPFLDDIEGCLGEMAYALDNLNACGVSLSACYGEGQSATYIGDKRYDAVWEELNRRQAVVFVHGSQIPGSTPYPHSSLGIPVTEVPNETFKAAAHLVVTGNTRKFPNVRIILAHLGGGVPMLAARVAVLSNHMGCGLTPEEILEGFKTFYYETALSGHEINLAAVEKLVSHDHILFGTDFPAVSTKMSQWFTNNVQNYYSNDVGKLRGVMGSNAAKMFNNMRWNAVE